MKTISQINSNAGFGGADESVARCFPLIDAHYHSEARASSFPAPNRSELRRFRNLSREFFRKETPRDYAREITLFSIIAAVSAWPIVSMVRALFQLLK